MYNLNQTDGHHWGNCESCKFWHTEHEAQTVEPVGDCEQPELTRFALQVSAHSGCERHEAAEAVA